MMFILSPPGLNWFYEDLAQNIHQELSAAGRECRVLTPHELLQQPAESCMGHDILIVNFSECAYSLRDNADNGPDLRQAVLPFNRRILLNLDCIYGEWFSGQMAAAAGVLTDVFDICAIRQTEQSSVLGCAYTWIPETFSIAGRAQIPPRNPVREIPWAMIGHQTLRRSELVNTLISTFSSRGLVFMPALRPYSHAGNSNFSPNAMRRILSKTAFYIWTSHHEYPYHEGLRSLHALECGAVPVKICPLHKKALAAIPWVYESVEEFMDEVDESGIDRLYARALEFVMEQGTLGHHLAAALDHGMAQNAVSERVRL